MRRRRGLRRREDASCANPSLCTTVRRTRQSRLSRGRMPPYGKRRMMGSLCWGPLYSWGRSRRRPGSRRGDRVPGICGRGPLCGHRDSRRVCWSSRSRGDCNDARANRRRISPSVILRTTRRNGKSGGRTPFTSGRRRGLRGRRRPVKRLCPCVMESGQWWRVSWKIRVRRRLIWIL